MATELTKQQREDHEKAIQKVRDYYPHLKESGDDFIMSMTPGMVEFAERAIRAERERDEAVRLLRTMWEEGTLPEDMEQAVAALLAAHPANGGQDEPRI